MKIVYNYVMNIKIKELLAERKALKKENDIKLKQFNEITKIKETKDGFATLEKENEELRLENETLTKALKETDEDILSVEKTEISEERKKELLELAKKRL